jgi:hypothetical protein
VASARKLGSGIARCTTVLQDIVDQRLLVMDVQRGRDNVINERAKVRIRSWRVQLFYYYGRQHMPLSRSNLQLRSELPTSLNTEQSQ